MKRYCKSLCALLILLLTLTAAMPAALGAQEPAGRLSFDRDGTFTVLVLSDLQDTQYTSPYLLRAMRNVLAEVKLDLVVLLGNQLDGRSPLLRLGGTRRNAERTIANLLEPLDAAGVPFAVVLGELDYAAQPGGSDPLSPYLAHPLCVTPERSIESGGAYMLPVYADGSDVPALNLYLFDSGYTGAVSEAQVEWFIGVSGAYRDENGNQPVPSAAFLHAPVAEMYELLSPVEKGVKGAVRGSGAGAEHYYLLSSERIFTGDIRETPAASADNHGLFDAFVGSDSVFLTVSGNNATNTFIASYRGVDLASVPGATYAGTGSAAARGARLFRFNEASLKNYDTLLVPFSDYDGKPAGLPGLHYYLSTTTAIPAYVKAVIAGALLIAAMAVLVTLILKKDPSDLAEQPDESPESRYL